MLKTEFETLAGYEVSLDDYNNIIEPMYMATELDKEEFVKCISKKRFALKPKTQLLSEMKKIAQYIQATSMHYADDLADVQLSKLIEEYRDRFFPGFRYHVDTKYTLEEYERGGIYPYRVVFYSPNGSEKSYIIPLI